MAIDLTLYPSEGIPTTIEVVSASNSVDFARLCAAIYVGTAGDVAAVAANNVAYLFKNVPAGSYLFGMFRRVNSTNTTATDMVALS